MKKLIAIISLVLVLCMLTACGGEKSKTIDITKVKEQIVTELSIKEPMDVKTDRLMDLYGIEAKDVKTSASFVTMDGVFPDEIVMIEAVDASAASRISEKLENRLTEVKNQSASYDAENYALAQKCKVTKTGNYVTLFISAKHEEMQRIFDSAAK